MALPPPLHDPTHIETRLLVVAEMLEKAVTEVRRAMAEIRSTTPTHGTPPFPPDQDTDPTSPGRRP